MRRDRSDRTSLSLSEAFLCDSMETASGREGIDLDNLNRCDTRLLWYGFVLCDRRSTIAMFAVGRNYLIMGDEM